MDPLDPTARRKARQRAWAARERAYTAAATPAEQETARCLAQQSAETSARARLADYATGLLNRRLIEPAPVPFISWMA